MIDTVLFDLDGTLLDTGQDIAHAFNALRAEQGHAPVPYRALRDCVSHGATAIMRCGYPDLQPGAEFDAMRARFLDLYAGNIAQHTRLFDGWAEVLDTLEADGLRWGVVTNKPAWLTDPLLGALRLTDRAACAVSGDTTPYSKPHPAPILRGCEIAGTTPAAAVYVGDAERDVQAGRAAGLRTAIALFGYIGPEDRPHDWGADALLDAPADLTAWLDTLGRSKELRA
ncbi:MAG: HAD-IA family hydrolase [Xanthomonadaceae bacterium]|nr:HAD-IA family hydrolase [Xanthomonadaceae bacterium]